MMIFEDSKNIRIEGHTGTWYVVDSLLAKNGWLYELENEQYGDESAHLIVDEQGNVVMDDVWNGFLDYQEEYEDDFQLRKEVEGEILDHMKEIAYLVRKYAEDTGTNDKYITLCLVNGSIMFNNEYWEHPGVGVLDARVEMFPEDEIADDTETTLETDNEEEE